MLPYNGWPAYVRYGRPSQYYYAKRNGLLKTSPVCIACGWTFVQGITYHAEDYGPTPEDHWASCQPLCNRCHAMLHARFSTPNSWKQYLSQVADGAIDDFEYPQGNFMAALLLKFKRRRDIAFVPMPHHGPDYLRTLPLTAYSGPPKVATLRVVDLNSGNIVEVPDWKLYGHSLEKLTPIEHEVLNRRGIDAEGFLTGRIRLPVDATGRRMYKRMDRRGFADQGVLWLS